MKASTRIGFALPLGLAFLPLADVPAGAGCGDIYPAMALGPFPTDAQTTPPLFYDADDASSGSFSVRWSGFTCGGTYEVTAAYADAPGSAAEPADYSVPEGQRTPPVGVVGPPSQATITFPIANDGSEQVAETFTVVLSEPMGGTIDPPPSAPFVLVDADGSTRVAFDDLPYSQTETFPTLAIPVWRAGPVVAGTTVSYTVGPGSGPGATQNEDYAIASPNPLTFAAGDRVEVVTLSVVNDSIAEGSETVDIALQGPGVVAPSVKTVTILDNEESDPPTSRLHHPRHRWRYKKNDYRIREVHVFTHDNTGGAGVTATQFALRRNYKGGDCGWLTKKGWKKQECDEREWLGTTWDPIGELWRIRLKQLRSSVETRIKNYTAFSRAVDGAGNVEKDFKEKRNSNTFEVARSKKRR
jgi:hypothetical protein